MQGGFLRPKKDGKSAGIDLSNKTLNFVRQTMTSANYTLLDIAGSGYLVGYSENGYGSTIQTIPYTNMQIDDVGDSVFTHGVGGTEVTFLAPLRFTKSLKITCQPSGGNMESAAIYILD